MAHGPDPSKRGPHPPRVRESGLGPDDPFGTPVDERRLDRRFRGRLVAPVTVWTAASLDRRAGLTVSSLLVAEGEPAEVLGLIDPLSELFDVLVERGAFVVHVLDHSDRRLAGMFAGEYPLDAIEEVDLVQSELGPVLSGSRHTLGCRLAGSETVGFRCSCGDASRRSTSVPTPQSRSCDIAVATAVSRLILRQKPGLRWAVRRGNERRQAPFPDRRVTGLTGRLPVGDGGSGGESSAYGCR